MKEYYIYFMTNVSNHALYVGVTNNIDGAVQEHKNGQYHNWFTAKHKCHKLVYVELHHSILKAIAREKSIKNWNRAHKNQLINTQNPDWIDLAAEWEFK